MLITFFFTLLDIYNFGFYCQLNIRLVIILLKVEIIGLIKKGVRLTFTRTTNVVFFLFKFAKYSYSSIINIVVRIMKNTFYLIALENVIKDGFVEVDTHLPNIIGKNKFPVIADGTSTEGKYIDIITGEVIFDSKLFPNSDNLHAFQAIPVDPRFCKFHLLKLTEKGISNYISMIENIKKYTIRENHVNKAIELNNEKSNQYIKDFKKKLLKNK